MSDSAPLFRRSVLCHAGPLGGSAVRAGLFSGPGPRYHACMRIACTSCNAVYDLPADRVRPGRGVKCARCGTVWVPVALVDAEPEIQAAPEEAWPEPVPQPEAEPGPEPGPEPEPKPGPVQQAEVQPAVQAVGARRRVPVLVGWVLSLVVLAGIGWGLVAFRAGIMQHWPPSERAYRLVGLGGGTPLVP